jgi:hypothetical protein
MIDNGEAELMINGIKDETMDGKGEEEKKKEEEKKEAEEKMVGENAPPPAVPPISRSQQKTLRRYKLKKLVNVRTCAYSFDDLYKMYKTSFKRKISRSFFCSILRHKIIHPHHGTDKCNICEIHKQKRKNGDEISFLPFFCFPHSLSLSLYVRLFLSLFFSISPFLYIPLSLPISLSTFLVLLDFSLFAFVSIFFSLFTYLSLFLPLPIPLSFFFFLSIPPYLSRSLSFSLYFLSLFFYHVQLTNTSELTRNI